MEIIGREAELGVVDRFLDDVRDGARALLLTGEAGIGKTTVWQAALDQAGRRGYRVIRSRPTEAEARLPYAALSDLLGGMLDELHDELPSPQRSALDVALLRTTDAGTAFEPLAISLAVLNLLRAAAQATPVILGIDDAPWLDGSSSAALEFALRRLESEPIGLVAAQRLADIDGAVHPLARALEHVAVDRLEVAGLEASELDLLLERQLGMRASPSMLARLRRISAGNPFYALELARSVKRQGISARDEDVALPDTLAGLIRDRFATLSAGALDLTVHAAALSQPTRAALEMALGAK